MSVDSPDDLSVDLGWIGAQLARDGATPRARFDAFVGDGQMSRTARFGLVWDDTGASVADAPTSVIAKLPSAQPATRRLCFQRGTYRRELDFFEIVAPRVDVTTPRCLGWCHDPGSERFTLLLEDLHTLHAGDQFETPAIGLLESSIDQAVRLHAPGSKALADPLLDGLRRRAGERSRRYPAVLLAALPVVAERLGTGLDSDVRRLLDEFVERRELWAAATFEPETIIHGDFRVENFMFDDAAAPTRLVVLDWQAVGVGPGVLDVAFLLGGALEPELRRELEPGLIDRYRRGLASAGAGSPATDEAYAIATLYGVAMATNSTARADVTERGDALFTLMLNRHGRHAIEWDALDALEAA